MYINALSGSGAKQHVARQTKERAEQKRESILDAATDMFFRHGVARTSLEEVARGAGVTRGAVYWHFRDKLDLFAAIEERLRAPQEAQLIALTRSSPRDPLGELERVIVQNLNRIAVDETMRIQMTVVLLRVDHIDEMAPAMERQAAYQRRFSDGLQCYFRDVVPAPGTGCDWTPVMAAHVLHTLIHGTILRALRFPQEYPLQTYGLSVVRAFMKALRRNWIRTR
jgi:TetR/AcrR family transcriptional regulator, acrAB operon repressor